MMRASSNIHGARSLYGEAFAQEFSQVGSGLGGGGFPNEPGCCVG
jgi:hypothetical protein